MGNSTADPDDNRTTFEYRTDRPHYLDKAIDPLGRESVQTAFDTNGRLSGLTDAQEKTITLEYDTTDPQAPTQTIRDQLSGAEQGTSVVTYDARGNVTQEVNAQGEITWREFGDSRFPEQPTNEVRIVDEDDRTTTLPDDRPDLVTVFKYDADGNLERQIQVIGLEDDPATNGERDDLVTLYGYTNRQLTSVSDPLGNSTQYVYQDEGGLALGQTDLLATVDPLLNTTFFRYTPKGDVEKVTTGAKFDNFLIWDILNDGWYEENYDPNADPSEPAFQPMTGPELPVTSFTYFATGDLATTTDPSGVTRVFGHYEPDGTLVTGYDPNGNLEETTFEWVNPNNSADKRLVTTTTVYDAEDRATQTITPAGTAETQYDEFGRAFRTIDRFGGVTEQTYDTRGLVIETKRQTTPDAQGVERWLVTETVYDEKGRAIWTTDEHLSGVSANGTHTHYDKLDRVFQTDRYADVQIVIEDDPLVAGAKRSRLVAPDLTQPSPPQPFSTRTTDYDNAGRVVEVTEPSGLITRLERDARGFETATVNIADGIEYRTEYEYDAAGRRSLMRDARGNETRYERNAKGLLTKTTFADGTFTTAAYDLRARRISETDQVNQTTNYEYSPEGKLIAVVLPEVLNPETGVRERPTFAYQYNVYGNLAVVRDGKGRETRFTYDELDRQTSRTLPQVTNDPTVRTETQTYDAFGRTASIVDFKGQKTEFVYDASDPQGRLSAKNYYAPGASTPSETVTYTYDVYDAQGFRHEHVTTIDRTTDYSYDRNGLLRQVASPEGTVNYDRDAATGWTVRIYTANSDVRYTRDDFGRISTVAVDKLDGVTLSTPETTTYIYDAVGNLSSVQRPNGTSTAYEYDSLNRTRFVAHTGPAGELLDSEYYLRDALGNVSEAWHDVTLSQAEQLESTGGQADDRTEYAYDELARLIAEDRYEAGAVTRAVDYAYDLVGNRLSMQTQTGAQVERVEYDYNELDQLFSDQKFVDGVLTDTTEHIYDANGNLISRRRNGSAIMHYEWNFENRLKSVDTNADGTTDVTYRYNDEGLRVAETVGGEETRFLHDLSREHPQVIEELTPGGIIKVSYVYGNERIAQSRDGVRSYFHADALGSVQALTDANAGVTDRFEYDAYGKLLWRTGTTETRYLFVGERFDPSTGFYDLRARLMDPSIGGFIAADPFPGVLAVPITLHKRVYAGDNPVNFVDPSGLFFLGSNMKWGQDVHKKIGAHFLAGRIVPNRRYYDRRINTILRARVPNGTERPDLAEVNAARGIIFEIKAAGDWIEGRVDLGWYLGLLNAFDPQGRPWSEGDVLDYTPPSVVWVAPGVIALVDPPIDGVILYQVIDLNQVLELLLAYAAVRLSISILSSLRAPMPLVGFAV